VYGVGGGTWGKETTWQARGMDWRLMLERILNKSVGRVWNGLIWLRIGKVAGFCEYGNEHSRSMSDFRLSPRSERELRTSGLLRSD